MTIYASCPRCHDHTEHSAHVVRDCHISRDVWEYVGLSPGPHDDFSDFGLGRTCTPGDTLGMYLGLVSSLIFAMRFGRIEISVFLKTRKPPLLGLSVFGLLEE